MLLFVLFSVQRTHAAVKYGARGHCGSIPVGPTVMPTKRGENNNSFYKMRDIRSERWIALRHSGARHAVNLLWLVIWCAHIIDPIHDAAMMNKKRDLACIITANLRVST